SWAARSSSRVVGRRRWTWRSGTPSWWWSPAPEIVALTGSGSSERGGPGPPGAPLDEARRQASAAASRSAAAETAWHEAHLAAGAARAQHDSAARAVEANASRHRVAVDARERLDAELAEATSEQAVEVAQRQ